MDTTRHRAIRKSDGRKVPLEKEKITD